MSTALEHIQLLSAQIKKYFFFILLISLIGAIMAGFIVNTEKGIYATYSKIFPLSAKQGSSSSPIDAIKSQFGITDKTDLDKIYNVTELVTSRRISRNIASQKPKSSKYKTYAEWLINDHNDNIAFWKHPIKYKKDDSLDILYKGASILGKRIIIENDPKVGFTTIRTSAYEEELAKEINESILSELSKFYIKFSTEKAQSDLIKIRILRDSLKDQLYGLENSIAGEQDASLFSVKSSTNIPQARLMRNRMEVEQLYNVASNAYQNARFKLLSESPIFQVLDQPGAPYDFSKPVASKFAFIVFALLFIFLSLFICRKVFWQMIIEELSKS